MDVTNNIIRGQELTWECGHGDGVCGGTHCLEIYLLEMFYCLVHEIASGKY